MYKYVWSVIDIFSRFLWLVPLESKSSSRVVGVLQPIYDQHGPDRLQSDRGTEFEGKLRTLHVQKLYDKNDKIKTLSPAITREGRAISPKPKDKDYVWFY